LVKIDTTLTVEHLYVTLKNQNEIVIYLKGG